ncbi:MAG: hypothetical protein ACYDCK_01295 [Thermoplasmatota archaeon]
MRAYVLGSIELAEAVVALFLVAFWWTRLPRRSRVALTSVAVVVVALNLPYEASFVVPDSASGDLAQVYIDLAFAASIDAVLVLVAAAALAYAATAADARGERRAFVCVAVGFGLLDAFIGGPGVPNDPAWLATGIEGVATLVACGTWALALAAPDARPARHALLGLVGALFAGVAYGGLVIPRLGLDPAHDYGANGVVRTVAASILSLAIFRYDLLGVRLPSLAARRGMLATAALAVLFIVAQVAQNFLASQYGLILGGVVAGAFLFAAHPLQRALEHGFGRAAREPRGAALMGSAAREQYKTALRLALHDGAITRAEERYLAKLAQQLGVGAHDALELRDAVEGEGAGSGAGEGGGGPGPG